MESRDFGLDDEDQTHGQTMEPKRKKIPQGEETQVRREGIYFLSPAVIWLVANRWKSLSSISLLACLSVIYLQNKITKLLQLLNNIFKLTIQSKTCWINYWLLGYSSQNFVSDMFKIFRQECSTLMKMSNAIMVHKKICPAITHGLGWNAEKYVLTYQSI